MKELKEGVTILIPTYNRKDRLINTLKSISSQGFWSEYQIVIVDNCSDYDVKGAIMEEFPDEFTRTIMVHRWFFNTGMSTNISISFEFVETKWCWFISDDDEILDGAISTILTDIKSNKKCAAIKYSIKDVCHYDNRIINNVDEWSNYYIENSSGDKAYLSMLYNISLLYPYLSELTIHSYSYLSFWIPVLRAINETKAVLKMSSKVLFVYKHNNDGWSSSNVKYLDTLVGIRTLLDFRYNFSDSDFYCFKAVFCNDFFCARSVVGRILLLPSSIARKHYYRLLNQYLSGSTIEKMLTKSIFYLVILLNIKPRIIQKILSIKNELLYKNV